jgi:hypothetical protein
MIQANELRIGNKILNSDNEIVTVTELRDEFYLNESKHGQYYATSNPIPLTPEILEKCGFVKEDDKISTFWKLILNRSEAISIEDDGSFGLNAANASSSEGYASSPDLCKYLHQLQNLYYSLTGTELNYTPSQA